MLGWLAARLTKDSTLEIMRRPKAICFFDTPPLTLACRLSLPSIHRLVLRARDTFSRWARILLAHSVLLLRYALKRRRNAWWYQLCQSLNRALTEP